MSDERVVFTAKEQKYICRLYADNCPEIRTPHIIAPRGNSARGEELIIYTPIQQYGENRSTNQSQPLSPRKTYKLLYCIEKGGFD